MKATKKPNAAKMSKAALIKEARQSRKALKSLRERLEEAERELARRDRASDEMKEISQAALMAALCHFEQWKEEGRPSYGQISAALDEIFKERPTPRHWGADFFNAAYMSEAEYYLQIIEKAENAKEARKAKP